MQTRRLPVLLASVALSTGLLAAQPATAKTDEQQSAASLPAVSPTPQQIDRHGGDVIVPPRAQIVVGPETDPAARELLVEVLTEHGVRHVDVSTEKSNAPLTFLLGTAERPDVADALERTEVPEAPESYAMLVDRDIGHGLGRVTLGGADGAGQFYAVQTLRQLFVDAEHGPSRISGAEVTDSPSMPLRGTIEGFYGEPWTHAQRLDQLDFYGEVKANTYIYAPKDDPYHRERWREPYPEEQLEQLRELVERADSNHVRFTFALSPGNTVCYSSENDLQALIAKLDEMYDIGVRAFSVPLDDIAYEEWNCPEDEQEFGPASPGAAGKAQTQLLDRIQQEFIEERDGTFPLQMVPTEYADSIDSPYKEALRGMDDDIVVMWTGNDVVPPAVTNEEAQEAADVFGGPPFLWDNYPVNDFDNTSGRLLLAPYAKRDAGLSDHLSGIVANPMNQAAASKVAVFGAADFAWNDRAYDPDRSWVEAMRLLADDDATATQALRVFGDLNHLAPTFGDEPWQPQAPVLDDRIERFWAAWQDDEQDAAVDGLRDYVDRIADAPEEIRSGPVDSGFVAEAEPWLNATDLWGTSLQTMLDALEADLHGEHDRAVQLLSDSEELADQAQQIVVTPPVNRWGEAPVKIADGVLDEFLASAAEEIRNG